MTTRTKPAADVKVVLIAMFEPGHGQTGELTRFRTGLKLRPWPLEGVPAGSLWRNEQGVAALVAGVGPVNTAVNVLTLGLHPGMDWRKTYWLVCGIAGGNPAVCSLGSPMFAEWVVDGDLAIDLHPADCPLKWSTGLLPLGAQKPFGRRKNSTGLFGHPAQVFHLNSRLAAWACREAQSVPLFDSAELAATRLAYRSFTQGAQAPMSGRGDVLSAARFWHGASHHRWAEHWVKYWTKGRGRLATASMEDAGTLGALRQLHRLQRADWRRILVLRTVSNYTVPPPGQPAQLHLFGDASVHYPGLEAALENGWRVGGQIMQVLSGKKKPKIPQS
jgi:purine nucleoside permease